MAGLPIAEPLSVDVVYKRIVDMANGTLSFADNARTAIRREGMTVDQLVDLHRYLRSARAFGVSVQGTTGLVEYAQQQRGDPAYDINAAFVDTVTAGAAVTDWIAANVRNDGQGGYVAFTHDGSDFTRTVMAPAALEPLAVLLDSLITTIRGQ